MMLKGAPEKGLAALSLIKKTAAEMHLAARENNSSVEKKVGLARESLIASQTIADMAKT